MDIEERILNDPQCQPYVDQQRKWIHEAFMAGVGWAQQNGAIIWHTGIPKERGTYLTTTTEGIVGVTTFSPENNVDAEFFDYRITAWCNLTEIKPY